MEYLDVGKYFVSYVLPILAFTISLLSLNDAKKANRIHNRVQELEEKLKVYELEDKELERAEAQKACVEARVMQVSKNNYRLKVWNSGKATAYNVNFEVQEEFKGLVWREKVPYEFLEEGKNFDEIMAISMTTPRKFKVKTTWQDGQNNPNYKEQIVSV